MPDASLSVKGKIQLATSAEVSTGTDSAKAVTPAALKPALDAKLNASGALAAIGAAASGANSDITSLSGLTTPLSVAQGGTGRTTAVSSSDALAVMYALLYCRSQSRASGPIPSGYIFSLLTDELATKTNAAFDATGKFYSTGTEPAYTNSGGTGDRTASITATTSFTFSNGTASNLVDGGFADNSTDSAWVSASVAAAGKYNRFQFASAVRITEAKWYQAAAAAQGVFQWQGSNDATNWTDIGGKFTLGSASTATQTQTELAANTADYLYYQLLGVSGNLTSATYFREIEFKAGTSVKNITLIPAAVTTAAHPGSITVRFLHQAVDAVTYGTDIKARVSTDGGSNWSDYGTITKLCAYDATYDLLEATFDTSALTGTSLEPEITTYNTKAQHVAGIALGYA